MSNDNKKQSLFGSYLKHLSGRAFVLALMYLSIGAVVFMISTRGEKLEYSKMMIIWAIGFALLIAYNFFFAWVNAGSDYEMLVSGNLKRRASNGVELKISSHKVYKEYRPWKGVLLGVFPAILAVIFGIVFGVKGDEINQTIVSETPMQASSGLVVFLGFISSGWSLLPFYAGNLVGITPNYYLSTLLALVPLAVSAGVYIAGAYAKRSKVVRQQAILDRQRQLEEQRLKKPNLGANAKSKKRK